MNNKSNDKPLQKQTATFGQPWEQGDVYGFAPAVKINNRIYLSGQTASDPDGDMEAQMREAYAAIEAALAQLGATMHNVVDETLYVTDVDAAGACAARVRSDVYKGQFEMASTLLGVARLGHPQYLIEIKCVAEL